MTEKRQFVFKSLFRGRRFAVRTVQAREWAVYHMPAGPYLRKGTDSVHKTPLRFYFESAHPHFAINTVLLEIAGVNLKPSNRRSRNKPILFRVL